MVFHSKENFLSEQANWQKILAGDVAAFESVVKANQSAVSAVAFSIIGDFSISQDIAQETFWTAWNSKTDLQEPRKLGAWLCGIARNLSRQWCRKHRAEKKPTHVSLEFDPEVARSEQETFAISEEEQAMVWRSLEEIPEIYREVLVLYYRQEKSVAEVSSVLEINEEAVRQRLSRGRKLLRSQVATLVEQALGRSAPGQAFTSCVMAGLAGSQVLAKAASASSASGLAAKAAGSAAGSAAGTIATSAMKAGAATGAIGGLLGFLGGLGGAWLGSWLPAQLAPTETERQLLQQRARPLMVWSLLFALLIVAVTSMHLWLRFHWLTYLLLLAIPSVIFTIVVVIQSVRTQKLVMKLREELEPEADPNQSWLVNSDATKKWTGKRSGRSYQSSARLLGLPLVDIQVADRVALGHVDAQEQKTARGWIAVGDRAEGILVGIGGRARGFFAFGGVSTGVVSCGGVALGIFAVGGLAVGVLGLGGLALAWYALGGLALGYDAVGGMALGWHSAVGGGAIANEVAMGGFAWARDYAVGGQAIAEVANTDAAREVVEQETWKFAIDWFQNNRVIFYVGLAVFIGLQIAGSNCLYRPQSQE